MKKIDSNQLNSEIRVVCAECGIAANVLNCLYKYGQPPKKLCFGISTYHTAKCDWCKKRKPVTEVRDFFYPNFYLLKKAQEMFDK